MNTKHLRIGWLLAMLILLMAPAYSQPPVAPPLKNPLKHVNQQLRDIFTPLSRPAPVMEYLYDMSGHYTDDKFWTPISYDPSTSDNWYALYWETYHMAYDQAGLPTDQDIYDDVLDMETDKIPIGVLDKSYYELVPGALNSNQYFDFDVSANKIYDKPGRPSDPYVTNNIFTCAPLFGTSKYGRIAWQIDPQYMFVDGANQQFYDPLFYTFQVDFGDGNGWVTFDPLVLTEHVVDYNGIASQGQDIAIQVRIMKDGVLYKHSVSRFMMGNAGKQPRAADEVIQVGGLDVSIFKSCNSTPATRKVVIYLEGMDIYDFSPRLNRTAEDVYFEMLQEPRVSQLSNFGYDFYVVDWGNSRRDLHLNSMDVVELIDLLKGQITNDNLNEFVIMGESMGGIIARYVTTYMESPNYTDPLLRPIANKRERMHNCRLMVSIDAPHQGANLPMGLQHFYKTVTSGVDYLFGTPMLTRYVMRHFNLFLDADAAKQLLYYHVDTKGAAGLHKTYTQHQKRTDFVNNLAAMGNYPQYCKKLAISNGALNGEKQTQSFAMVARAANDRILTFSADLYAKILGILKVPVAGADVDIRTNPDGQGQVFQMNAGTWGIRVKFYLWGVQLITGYNTLVNVSEYADVKPFCTNAGGYYGSSALDPVIGNSTNNSFSWRFNLDPMLTFASIRSGSDGYGCWSSYSKVGFDGFAKINFDLSLCSDGLWFCLVPTQSALDYGTLGSVPLDYDFEADLNGNPSLINSNTEFDVIVAMGEDDDQPPLSLPAQRLNQQHLYVKYMDQLGYMQSQFPYGHCVATPEVHGHWLNREIGDEWLFLDNRKAKWNSDIEVQSGIMINTFGNPWYTYPGSGVGSHVGFYSKADYFEVLDNVNVDFFYDYNSNYPPPGNPNYLYFNFVQSPNQSGYTGIWTENQQNAPACSSCEDFSKKTWKDYAPLALEEDESFATIYPNPTQDGQVNLACRFSHSGEIHVVIMNVSGQVVYDRLHTGAAADQENILHLNLPETHFQSGMYFVNVSSGSELFDHKLIVN